MTKYCTYCFTVYLFENTISLIMKKLLLILNLLPIFSIAESRFIGDNAPEDLPTASFQEIEQTLPDFPNIHSPQWLELYVNPTNKDNNLILLDSIHYSSDGSIHYIINKRSAAHFDNISAEGMVCVPARLGAGDAQVKVFAYADVTNQRWITTRYAKWQNIGIQISRNDNLNNVLYESFCSNGKAKNDIELRNRIKKEAAFSSNRDYSK